ncbi:MAG TPA: asparagine synthase (glutamine-hydrolyzing) [Isosphaeraceae bacterium]
MCGIAGIIQREPAPGVIEAMLGRLAHRGPDGGGTWSGRLGPWSIVLGHRRLAIIDIEGGRQPMGNEDGSVQITYNGEVYNFQDLRRAQERAGHRFASRSDTEAILHHCEQEGPEGLAALDGMFAFGLWDQGRGRLLLARDRAGIKPLYYARLPDGGIAFASELTALLMHPALDRRLSAEGLRSYFFSDYAHPSWTLVAGARKLEPGHSLTWHDGRMAAPEPFWRWSPPEPGRRIVAGEDVLARELWDRLGGAVRRQLVADVPIGVFLSGGIDSSSVAYLAQQAAGGRLATFSIGFEDPSYDESAAARRVARLIGSEHVEERLGAETVLDVTAEALDTLDEPLADHSYLPTYLLARLAARHRKVVLSGDGGDELWAGYPTYRAHRYARYFGRIPRPLRAGLIPALVARLPLDDRYQSLEWKLKRFVLRWDDDPYRRHLRWMAGTDLADLDRAVPDGGVVPETLRRPVSDPGDPLNALLMLDFTTYLPGSVLTKVDRAAMAHGLEVRPPMLDNALIDWAFAIASTRKLRGGVGKAVLKRAAAAYLPRDIVHRPKRGFSIPLATWLRGPLRPCVEEALDSPGLWEGRLLDRGVFRSWNERHQARRADYSKPLWALVVLDRWARRERIDAVAPT